MEAKCPHCGKNIDLVGPGDLNQEFDIGPNALQHAREKGKFPEPWISLNNRNLWLRADIEAHVAQRSRDMAEKAVRDLMRSIEHLPPKARQEARKMFEEGLQEPRKRSRK